MQYLYTFIISFIFIFLSEMGDKTQILVLSFSTQNKASHILIGIALGTLLSHGLAILLGSNIASLGNDNFIFYLKIATYITFLLFGILGFIKRHSIQTSSESKQNIKSKITDFIHSILRNCILLVAISIALGEIGDKTGLITKRPFRMPHHTSSPIAIIGGGRNPKPRRDKFGSFWSTIFR